MFIHITNFKNFFKYVSFKQSNIISRFKRYSKIYIWICYKRSTCNYDSIITDERFSFCIFFIIKTKCINSWFLAITSSRSIYRNKLYWKNCKTIKCCSTRYCNIFNICNIWTQPMKSAYRHIRNIN